MLQRPGPQHVAREPQQCPHEGASQALSKDGVSGVSPAIGMRLYSGKILIVAGHVCCHQVGRLSILAHSTISARERERELRKEGREVPSRVRLREGPIGVRITLGQPTIG